MLIVETQNQTKAPFNEPEPEPTTRLNSLMNDPILTQFSEL